jgi:hypothetical protein
LFLTIPHFFLSSSIIWTLTYFFFYLYVIFFFSVLLYLLANIREYLNFNNFSNFNLFSYLTGFDLMGFNLLPLLLIILLNWSWTGPTTMAWFGHLIFSNLQFKINYLFFFFFFLILIAYFSVFYYSSAEIYDYIITIYSFFFWLNLLFFSNNIFTFIFFIEVLSTLISLLFITSTFSSLYFYNNISLTLNNYFNNSTPFAFLQTLLFFFWISLVSSLNLFVFLILLYIKFLTFNWFLLEAIFSYVILNQSFKSIFYISLTWFNFMFCIFLKCGVVPFYFWKPTFFKGLSLHVLMFYILIFYFFLFNYLIFFFLIYLNDLFYFNTLINFIILMFGLIMLLFIILESFYIKAFLAISSIINTFFVFLAMSSFNIVDLTLVL